MTHEEQKQLYLAYQKKARDLFEDVGPVDSSDISVPDHANVQMVETGAFIEAIVWVPKEKL